MPPPNIFVDDDPLVWLGISAALAEVGGKVVRLQESGDFRPLFEADGRPVLILGVRSQGPETLAPYRALRSRHDPPRVILLIDEENEQIIVAAIEAGVEGLVFRGSPPESLADCVRSILAGERWIEQRALQHALDLATGRVTMDRPYANLTNREQEVLRLSRDHPDNGEIARRLGISPATVKVHLHNIYEKLGVANRADLLITLQKRVQGT